MVRKVTNWAFTTVASPYVGHLGNCLFTTVTCHDLGILITFKLHVNIRK